jgi:hypothetical protein
LAVTRASLHAVAEMLLAGPQFRSSGTIRLRVLEDGFGTVAVPDLRVEAGHLVAEAGRFRLTGTTIAALATSADIEAGAPIGVYGEGSGASPDTEIALDEAAAAEILGAFTRGDAALRRLAPSETPVLWPEHFDLGIGVGEVNYGVSPGDGWLDHPYAYVGPWEPRTGPFWNAPFGAARPMRDLSGGDALLDFWSEGRDRAVRTS